MNRVEGTVLAVLLTAGAGLGAFGYDKVHDFAHELDRYSQKALQIEQGITSTEPSNALPSRKYDRDVFGDAWVDTDRNGCDTRNDVLRRDLVEIELDDDDCTVLSGVLERDPYTGERIEFTRGRASSMEVQIDHIVPLAEAWRSGASEWNSARLVGFANDPGNLLAVDGPTNSSKSDSDPAEWMPPRAETHCTYITTWEEIKETYGMTMDDAEKRAVERVKAAC